MAPLVLTDRVARAPASSDASAVGDGLAITGGYADTPAFEEPMMITLLASCAAAMVRRAEAAERTVVGLAHELSARGGREPSGARGRAARPEASGGQGVPANAVTVRDIPLTVYVKPVDVMRARGVERRTAYRLLKEARGGREGQTTVAEWERYAHQRWGHGRDGDERWDDLERSFSCGSGAGSGSPRSTSGASGPNGVQAKEMKPKLPEWLSPGSKRAKLRVAKPRHAPSTKR